MESGKGEHGGRKRRPLRLQKEAMEVGKEHGGRNWVMEAA